MIKKNFHLIFIALAIVVIIYGFFFSNINSKRILKYPKYTIAKIISDWHYKNNTGIGVDYIYYVGNKKYNYTINIDLQKNEKYLLIYDSLKPSNCRILGIYPIADSIIAPTNGWRYKEIPIEVDSNEIKEYIRKYK